MLISKYAANREKDRRFTRAALAHGLVDAATLRARLGATTIGDDRRADPLAAIEADLPGGAGR
ncbi:MAG: hypothetical protein IT376_13515 [Polyangiaceae bacterium]|nr:hypothetical protein [Polyangiaceae bacterium]